MKSRRLSRLLLGALILAAVLPALAALAGWFVAGHYQATARETHIATAVRVLQSGHGRYRDPGWQSSAVAQLDALGVAASLPQAGVGNSRGFAAGVIPANAKVPVRRVTLAGGPAGGEATALLFAAPPNRTTRLLSALSCALAALGLIGLALSLAARRWIVRPIAGLATSVKAVEPGPGIAAAAPSRVREIDDLAAALVAMNERLRDAADRDARLQQERKFLISSVAHDLRTPLFLLRGYLDRAARRQPYSDLSKAQRKAAHIDRLVDDLYTYSGLTDQLPQLQAARVDVASLLAQVASDFTEQAEERHVRLLLEGSPHLDVLADEHAINRVAGNLIENAIRHTPEGGLIRLSWQASNGHVLVRVQDTGEGICPQDLEQVFEPMFRGDASRNSRTGGAGLGLAIARRLIEAHGGTLTAANAPSGGAIFTIAFPAA